MGRANNSFTSYVGHAEETMSDDRVTLPEKDLWVAVLCRAVLDACKGPPHLDMTRMANRAHESLYNYNRDQARHFLWREAPTSDLFVKWQDAIRIMFKAKLKK